MPACHIMCHRWILTTAEVLILYVPRFLLKILPIAIVDHQTRSTVHYCKRKGDVSLVAREDGVQYGCS